jgi:hypothetical protein
MLFIISDASVLIDVERAELTRAMFSLPWKFAVPDTLFSEELAGWRNYLSEFGLISKTLSSDWIAEAYSLHQKYPRTHVNGVLALVLAKHERCCLLTSDKTLLTVAEVLGVKAYDAAWLIKQMLKRKKISVEIAEDALLKMKNFGSRCSLNEIMLGARHHVSASRKN